MLGGRAGRPDRPSFVFIHAFIRSFVRSFFFLVVWSLPPPPPIARSLASNVQICSGTRYENRTPVRSEAAPYARHLDVHDDDDVIHRFRRERRPAPPPPPPRAPHPTPRFLPRGFDSSAHVRSPKSRTSVVRPVSSGRLGILSPSGRLFARRPPFSARVTVLRSLSTAPSASPLEPVGRERTVSAISTRPRPPRGRLRRGIDRLF